MKSSWRVLYLVLGEVMNKHTTKRLAEINSGINLKNAKASIANQPKDTLDAETARLRNLYKEAYAKSMAELNDYSSPMYITPLQRYVEDIRNALSPKEEK